MTLFKSLKFIVFSESPQIPLWGTVTLAYARGSSRWDSQSPSLGNLSSGPARIQPAPRGCVHLGGLGVSPLRASGGRSALQSRAPGQFLQTLCSRCPGVFRSRASESLRSDQKHGQLSWLRIGFQMQEVSGSNRRLGGLRGSPLQVSGGLSALQLRASGLQSTTQGISSGPKKTPPSQSKQMHAGTHDF